MTKCAKFIYTRGNETTMRKLTLLILAAILLAGTANAATLSDFPRMFARGNNFSAIYVIGEEAPALDVVSATVISTSLARYNLTTAVGTSRLDVEVGDITLHDAIIIGSPCENRAAAQLEKNPNPCNANLSGSAGYLKLFENNGKKQLLITGLTAEDRHQAARYLAREDLTILKLSTFIVPTKTGSKIPYFGNLTLKNTTVVKNATNASAPIVNATPETPKPANTTAAVNKTKVKPAIGEYEPLGDRPTRKPKGIFDRFWSWVKGIFT